MKQPAFPGVPDPTAPRTLYDRRSPMRDAIELSVDIYLPASGEGPWPCLLRRTPYIRSLAEKWVRWAHDLTQHGYAVAFQDVRGRGDSDGIWEPFKNEFSDGYDSVEWVASQSWCDGNVGMMGLSYEGFTPWAAARERPPHLRAIATMAGMGRWQAEWPTMFGCFFTFSAWWLHYTDGRMNQPYIPNYPVPDWPAAFTHVPLRDALDRLGRCSGTWEEWLKHPGFDDYWKEMAFESPADIPALHLTGWFDGDQWGQLHHWKLMTESTANDNQRLIVGPWDHGGVMINNARFDARRGIVPPVGGSGDIDYGDDARLDILAEHVTFFDEWLKGQWNRTVLDAPVRYFSMGADRWRTASHWPPRETTERSLYLHSNGDAVNNQGELNWRPPERAEPPDVYNYDPDDPTPSSPAIHHLPESAPESRPVDIAFFQDRPDVLVYTSAAFDEDVEVTGHPFVVLYASSDRRDTDWHVTLCDVTPEGRAIRISDGALRAIYRDGIDRAPRPLEPGSSHRFSIEMRAISNTFRPGHRIRLTVASASYPWHARNPNTGAALGYDDEVLIAENRIHHTPRESSHITLPCWITEDGS